MAGPCLESWLAGGPSQPTHTSAVLQTFAAAKAVALHMGKVLCVSQDRPGEFACSPACVARSTAVPNLDDVAAPLQAS